MTETDDQPARVELWPGDPGTLPLDVRRTLIALLRGPYLSQQRDSILWATLRAHEQVIRRHLGDLLLQLEIDADAEVAFTRNLEPGPDFEQTVPSVLRKAPLSFVDSALLLHLRYLLLQGAAQQERVVVGREEIDAHMRAYAASSGHDEAQFTKRLSASLERLRKWSILLDTDTRDRWEISSILALILTAEEIGGIEAEYQRLRDTRGDQPRFADTDDEAQADGEADADGEAPADGGTDAAEEAPADEATGADGEAPADERPDADGEAEADRASQVDWEEARS
ncbi:MAG TPA: DUF4194 domain-containing protein [Actinomycetaceae bacterium]|nr:DUF4194 domain-containing protein [Actinomycetaceae bacterium]